MFCPDDFLRPTAHRYIPLLRPRDQVIRRISWLTESLCAVRSTSGGAPLTLYTRDRRFCYGSRDTTLPPSGEFRVARSVILNFPRSRNTPRPVNSSELQVQRVKSFTMANITIETFLELTEYCQRESHDESSAQKEYRPLRPFDSMLHTRVLNTFKYKYSYNKLRCCLVYYIPCT